MFLDFHFLRLLLLLLLFPFSLAFISHRPVRQEQNERRTETRDCCATSVTFSSFFPFFLRFDYSSSSKTTLTNCANDYNSNSFLVALIHKRNKPLSRVLIINIQFFTSCLRLLIKTLDFFSSFFLFLSYIYINI